MNPWAVTFDIAAIVSALLWPLAVAGILIVYRKDIPPALRGLASRVQKLSVPGFSVDFAAATAFVPNWSGTSGAIDLRQHARSVEIMDSTRRNFLAQLTGSQAADYAEINLGSGNEWLCSRLYVMSILFSRMKTIDCFVFLETTGTTRRRFVGWADPNRVRWALAKHYPWLEEAYAEAYAATMRHNGAVVVDQHGRFAPNDEPEKPDSAITLLQAFLTALQMMVPPGGVAPAEGWVLVDEATNSWERASWVSADLLETLLGDALETRSVEARELATLAGVAAVLSRLAPDWRYVALVTPEHRLERVLHGERLVTALTNAVTAQTSQSAKSGEARA